MSRQLRLVFTAIAIVAVITAVTATAVLLPPQQFLALQGLAIVAGTYAGKFIVLAPVLQSSIPFSSYFLAGLIAFMDIVIGLLVAAYLDVLYAVPWIGEKLRLVEERGHETLGRHPWVGRLAFLGVALLVMFPVSGTGAIGSTVFGRLIGLGPKTIVLGITVGTLIGSFVLAAFARQLSAVLEPVQDEPWFKAIGWGVLIALAIPIVWQYIRSVRESSPPRSLGARADS
ncbi:MAG: small multi-drug export protein [Myxococcota bacterium]